MPTRRKFLFDCSAVITAALTAPGVVMADSAMPSPMVRRAGEIPRAAFASQVNTCFRIHTDAGRAIKVTLAEVKIRPEKPPKAGKRPLPDAGNEKFSLVFSGSRADLIQQDTYRLAHETLGRFDLFIVPIYTRNPAKIDYQAVINRPMVHSFKENQTKG